MVTCKACGNTGVIVMQKPIFRDGAFSDMDVWPTECPWCKEEPPDDDWTGGNDGYLNDWVPDFEPFEDVLEPLYDY
jgi:hypothetical protein